MDGQQQIDFIEYVRAARTLAGNPHNRATLQRPWRVSVMWRDVGDLDGMNFHFATEVDAQHALTMLVELFPDLVDLECSGVWKVGKEFRRLAQRKVLDSNPFIRRYFSGSGAKPR